MGAQAPPTRRGPEPKLPQQIEPIHKLPRPQHKSVMQMLDTVPAQASC